MSTSDRQLISGELRQGTHEQEIERRGGVGRDLSNLERYKIEIGINTSRSEKRGHKLILVSFRKRYWSQELESRLPAGVTAFKRDTGP